MSTKKIEKLRLKNVFEAVAVNEATSDKTIVVSIGAGIAIKKDNAGSALFIEATAGAPARYNKVEDKDLELPILENELAGLVGSFDASVNKLFAKYGYEWASPGSKNASAQDGAVVESRLITESAASGDVVNGNLIVKSIMVSKLIDAAAEHFNGDSEMEQKFRNKVNMVLQESDNTELAETLAATDEQEWGQVAVVAMETWLDDHAADFEDYAEYID